VIVHLLNVERNYGLQMSSLSVNTLSKNDNIVNERFATLQRVQ